MSSVPATILRGRLSEAELEQIEALAERRLSPGIIAMRLNRHPATVGYAMHRMGLRTLAKREFSYVRNGVAVKSFSAEEDAFVTALRVQGFTTTKIAGLVTKRFGHRRSPHTINVRLVLLSNSDAINTEAVNQ